MSTTTYPVPVLTLGQIRDANPPPCLEGWHALLDGLGQPHAGFDRSLEVTLGDIARINEVARGTSLGVADALWCLRCLPLKQARYWASALVSPTIEQAKQYIDTEAYAATEAAYLAAAAAEKAKKAKTAKSVAEWAVEAAEEAYAAYLAAVEVGAAWLDEDSAQLDDIIRLCPPRHQPAESEVTQ